MGGDRIYCYYPDGFGHTYWLGATSPSLSEAGFPDSFESPRNEAALLAEIADGLHERREWEDALADPTESRRLSRVAAYLIKSTSPSKYRTFVWEAETKRLANLGDAAVTAISGQMERRQEGDNLEAALHALCQTGGNLRVVMPLLLSLLDQPGPTPAGIILDCLAKADDPRAIPAIKNFAMRNTDPDLLETIAGILDRATAISERDLVNHSPLIAGIRLFPASPTLASSNPAKKVYQAYLVRNFRGELPPKFLIEIPKEREGDIYSTRMVAFLRPLPDGKYAPSVDPPAWRWFPPGSIRWNGGKETSEEEFAQLIEGGVARRGNDP